VDLAALHLLAGVVTHLVVFAAVFSAYDPGSIEADNSKLRQLRAPATNFVTLIGASLSSNGVFAFVAIARMPARRP
jgi:hypothetical protein